MTTQKKRVFLVAGDRPFPNRAISSLMAAADLGVSGVFRQDVKKVTITLDKNVTDNDLERQPDAIKNAFEKQGWKNVVIVEISEYLDFDNMT